MDRLTLEKEIKEKEIQQIEETKEAAKSEEQTIPQNSYVNSFEGQTIADIKREEEKKEHAEFVVEKEKLIQEQFVEKPLKIESETKEEKEEKSEKSVNVIEKPNYDLIEEPKKTIKLKKKENLKQKKRPNRLASIVLACVLGASAIVCIANFSVLDQMQNNLTNIEETYNLRLDKYMKNILNLDTTKKSMEFIETYPDKLQNAGDLGKKSNWFDRLCNYLGGLFGG